MADVGPFYNEAVVGQRLIRPLLALAHRVEPVSQVTGHLSVSPNVIEDGCRPRVALLLQRLDQPLSNLPDREALRRGRIPVVGELIPTEQPHLSALSSQDASFDE